MWPPAINERLHLTPTQLSFLIERSVPLLEQIKIQFKNTQNKISGKSTLAQAIRYSLSHWNALTRYTTDGRLDICNNTAERAIRPLAIGRKNWLFAGSDTGGERAAVMYTIIETAKLNGLNPEAYLRGIIARIADHLGRLHLNYKKLLQVVCLVISTSGLICFLVSILVGESHFLPDSFEWPVGYADNIISIQSGLHIVPHIPSGRIQIYSSDWKFIRGWSAHASGRDFKVMPFDEGKQQIAIVTARGDKKYYFDIDGKFLSRESVLPFSYNLFPKSGTSHWIGTSIWLLPLAQSYIAWCISMTGVVGWAGSIKEKKHRIGTAAVEYKLNEEAYEKKDGYGKFTNSKEVYSWPLAYRIDYH